MAEMRPEDVPDELVSAGRTAWREAFGQPVPAPDSMRKILAAFVGEFEQRLRKRAETAERALAEMRDRLAEERASRNPLLRCLLIKAAPDRDLYVGWSNNVEAPTGIWTRAEALAYGFPPSRLDRADKNGSSATGYNDGHWDDEGFVAEQRGWLRRDRLGDYAQAYAREDYDAVWDLLEPFEGETEVRRG